MEERVSEERGKSKRMPQRVNMCECARACVVCMHEGCSVLVHGGFWRRFAPSFIIGHRAASIRNHSPDFPIPVIRTKNPEASIAVKSPRSSSLFIVSSIALTIKLVSVGAHFVCTCILPTVRFRHPVVP